MNQAKRTAKVGDRVACGYNGYITGTITEIKPDPDYPRRLTAKVLEDDGEIGYWFLDSIEVIE